MKYRKSGRRSVDGLVYVVGSVADRRVKIGTSANPHGRLAELQSGNPNPLQILATVDGGHLLEGLLHDLLARFRSSGEWFDFGEANPVRMIEDAVVHLRAQDLFPDVEALEEIRNSPPPATVKERVLEALASHEKGLTLDQLARELGIVAGHLSPKLTEFKRSGHITHSNRHWRLAKKSKEE
ncbi:hypothetical protein Scani_34250 [Streptomyces caniferus]|uniref:Bacteriophage T5 Orf172 DNA-binding domain-containing protein n=1 Tax=Streptomyces caniferus TaxID=285557 RepID=A0A640S7Y8_9ACTN|nr:GIY-YIG nuclease family protein [Streptomyces caniferus]GFE07157.1 hypothetical protein Scani_34250 [Streptomyces caniferus]